MLKVDLEYYNQNEKRLLSQHPYDAVHTEQRILAFQKDGRIRRADFLSFYLIHRDGGVNHSFKERLDEAPNVIEYLKHAVSLGDTVNCTSPLIGGDYAERVGEAIGLSVISRMHGLIDADWTKLDVVPGMRTFDFEYASDNKRIIQVETKGSIVDDSQSKDHQIHQHAYNIRKKKRDLDLTGSDPYPALIRYGTISAIDRMNNAHCWILDPPADAFDLDPSVVRLAKRLTFIANAVRLITVDATLPEAISRRVSELALHRGEIRDWSGRPLPHLHDHGVFSSQNYVSDFLSTGKIYFPQTKIVGQAYDLGLKRPFFLGLDATIVNMAIDQDFEGIDHMTFDRNDQPLIAEVPVQERRVPMGLIKSSGGLVFGSPNFLR